jgi:hypothetical protein
MDTFYKVVNPTKEDLTIMVKGVSYTLGAEGSLDMIPEFVAKHWEGLHAFLKFEKMKSVPVSRLQEELPVVEEIVIEKVEEVVEEIAEEKVEEAIVEEVVEEKPVKKGKK